MIPVTRAVSRAMWVTALMVGAVLASAATGCTPTGPSGAAAGGQALVQAKCSMCHTLERVDQAKKDKAGWVATVDRMRGKGAVLTDEEAAQVTDYLAGGGK